MAQVLIVTAIVVAIVTVVGHGMWLAFAAFFRLLSGSRSPEVRRDCPQCGARASVAGGVCARCGATPLIRPAPSPFDDRQATLRELDRLLARGAISQRLFENLTKIVRGKAHSMEDLAATAADAAAPTAADGAAPTAPAEPAQPPAAASPAGAAAAEIVAAEAVDEEAAAPPPVTAAAAPPTGAPEVPPVTAPAESPFAPRDVPPAAAALHPLDRPDTPPVPSAPRRTLAVLLQAFMEEKNIRWGEIVSGLLIVVCAVGLVISLWATLSSAIPYLPALVFMLGTAAFHAAGHYTLRRWDLQQVSRAVLIIGMLLIPLNFLAAITLGGGEEQRQAVTDPSYLLAVAIGLAAYGTMTYFAGRALVGEGWWRMFVGVMGPSAGQLIIHRAYDQGAATFGMWLLVVLPLSTFLTAVVAQLWRARRWRQVSLRRAQPLYLVVGTSTFAVLAAAALLVSQADSLWTVLARLSPALSLVGAAILATGLVVHQRTLAARLGALRTSGTALAVAGAFVLLGAVGLAWPQPTLLTAVGVLNCGLLATMGFIVALPVLHAAAVVSAALAWVVAYHQWRGVYVVDESNLGRTLLRSLVHGETAAALTALAALVGGIAVGLRQAARPRDALGYFFGGAGVAATSLLVALVVGLGPFPPEEFAPQIAPPVLLLYTLGLLAAGWFLGDERIGWTATSLLLLALVQALAFVEPIRQQLLAVGLLPARPLLVALLVHALLAMLAGAALGRGAAWRHAVEPGATAWSGLVRPLSISALATSLLAAATAVVVTNWQFDHHAIYVALIAVVWLGVAAVRVWPWALWVAQLAATIAISFTVAAVHQVGSWTEWGDPSHLAVQLIVLALWCAAPSLLRRWFGRVPHLRRLLETGAPPVDQIVLGVLVAGLLAVATIGCLPGVLRELGLHDLGGELTWTEHASAYGATSWLAWLAVMAALAASQWERLSQVGIGGLLFGGAAACLLVAGPFEAQVAGASALRWLFAAYGAVLAACFWLRAPLHDQLVRRDWPGSPSVGAPGAASLEGLATALSALPVFVLTTLTVYQVASGTRPGGPLEATFFDAIGPTVSYALPLAVVTATLLAYAVREREPVFALAGSLLFQYLASLACLLPPLTQGRPLDVPTWAQLGQWNAAALGAYALVWLGLARWIERERATGAAAERLFAGAGRRRWISVDLQIIGAVAALMVLAVVTAGGVIIWPGSLTRASGQLGGWESYAALVLTAAAAGWRFRGRYEWLAHGVCGSGFCLTAFIAASLHQQHSSSNWLSFHVLMVGWTAVSLAATAAACWPRRAAAGDSYDAAADLPAVYRWVGWAAAMGSLVIALALEAAIGDPTGSWWSMGTTLAVAVAAGAAGLRVRAQWLAYASTVLVGMATWFLWLGVSPPLSGQTIILLADWLILATALAAGFWLGVELYFQLRHRQTLQADFASIRAHRFFATGVVLTVTALMVLGTAVASLMRAAAVARPLELSTPWGWLAVVAVGLLLAGTLWDRRARGAISSLYVWGFALQAIVIDKVPYLRRDETWGFVIDTLGLEPADMMFAVGVGVSLYAALTGMLWRRGVNLSAVGMRWGISDPVTALRRTAVWLPMVTLLLCWLAMLLGLIVVLVDEDRWQRIVAGFFPALLAVGVGSLAQAGRRATMQFTSLLLLGLAGVYLGWAGIEPGLNAQVWLDRVIQTLIVLCGAAFLYSVVVTRYLDSAGDWYLAVKRAALTAAGAALLVLVTILALEVRLFLQNPAQGAPISPLQLAAVSVVMVGLVAALITMALSPGRDPLSLSERGRMGYVYVAQLAAALLFAHIYLAQPEWFGQFREYWPYIVLAIAFAGAGVGELFRRVGSQVMADPLQRSSMFLPLIPAIGWWFVDSGSNYSLVLFVAGLTYVYLSVSRRSLVSAVAAAVAGNGALWRLLLERDFVLSDQPQLFLIPPALSVLIAAEINRGRLSEATLTAIRYACMVVIYVSSAGEIFIHGIEQIWPPMVLLGLSVAGVLAGIMLQIRAFLYLGATFVFMSLVSMVWHASRVTGQYWPWWAFGIGLGLAMLTLFGFFEKNRDKVTALVEQLRQWEP